MDNNIKDIYEMLNQDSDNDLFDYSSTNTIFNNKGSDSKEIEKGLLECIGNPYDFNGIKIENKNTDKKVLRDRSTLGNFKNVKRSWD